MAGEELITFKFEGGLADKHQMNYYDAARFHYGASRLLLKLQHYKNTGNVLQKVSVNVEADFRVEAIVAGSLVQTVWDFTKDLSSKPYIKAPVSAIFGWVTKKLTASTSPLEYVEKIKAHEASQKKEETEQLRIVADLAKKGFDAKDQFLDYLIKENGKLKNALGSDSGIYLISKDYQKQVEADLNSGTQAVEYHPDYKKVMADADRLVAANKGALQDLTKPIDGVSAESMAANDASGNTLGYVNQESVASLNDEKIDATPTVLIGKIKSFDFETGWGKFRNQFFVRPITFHLPSFKKHDEMPRIIEAAKRGEGEFAFYFVRTLDGGVARLILEKVISY